MTTIHQKAFEFVRQLADDLSKGTLQLPGYPEAALQLQRLLAADDTDLARIIRVISTEPMFAAQTLRMANSAALNPSGRAITELREAVARLGFDALRSAAMAYAVQHLRLAPGLEPVARRLDEIWVQSNALAAASFVVARRSRKFNPDTALLAGLVSGVGNLYLATRSSQYTELLDDEDTFGHMTAEWHPTISRSILESWSMGNDVLEAVQDFRHVATDTRIAPSLADVLAAGLALAGLVDAADDAGAVLQADPACQRLGLASDGIEQLLDEVRAEIAGFRAALQG